MSMQMIHTSLGRSKKRKPNAKQRELKESWEKLLASHASAGFSNKYGKPKKTVELKQPKPFIRETEKYPSLPFSGAPCTKPAQKVYTGTMIKGIGTMHKSNAVPIFSDEQAVEIATMRRG